jgi:hypothetical protein
LLAKLQSRRPWSHGREQGSVDYFNPVTWYRLYRF